MRKKIFTEDVVFIKKATAEGKNSYEIARILTKRKGERISYRTVLDHLHGFSKKYRTVHPTRTHCECGVSYVRHTKCPFCKVLSHSEPICPCRVPKEYTQDQLLSIAISIFEHAHKAGEWLTQTQ